jgi:hypothetical protein
VELPTRKTEMKYRRLITAVAAFVVVQLGKLFLGLL